MAALIYDREPYGSHTPGTLFWKTDGHDNSRLMHQGGIDTPVPQSCTRQERRESQEDTERLRGHHLHKAAQGKLLTRRERGLLSRSSPKELLDENAFSRDNRLREKSGMIQQGPLTAQLLPKNRHRLLWRAIHLK